MCAGAILEARVARLVFAARDAKGGCAGSVLDLLSGRFAHRVAVASGVLEPDAAALLAGFFRSRRGRTRTHAPPLALLDTDPVAGPRGLEGCLLAADQSPP